MNPRIPKRQPGMSGAEAALVQMCEALDRCIPGLRTLLLVAGLCAAALGTGRVADYLFVTGLVFQTALWFEHCWVGRQSG